ncbi:hypothetical protein PBF_18859 [Cytobacillus firmus DS1]|uniref:Uncharacterized protein n=1 Tax=Cytobacillus firmus DS1 TaxID=1307436 RepID=W7KTH4_CYTFI|nr:hypothetical protein PBF_18859 [Cytobacillus firmus DS1]
MDVIPGPFSMEAVFLRAFIALAAGFGLWIDLFCFLCLELARVLTLTGSFLLSVSEVEPGSDSACSFLLSVSEVEPGSDSGAPLSALCVRS